MDNLFFMLLFTGPILILAGFISLIIGYKKVKNAEVKSEAYNKGVSQVKSGIILLIIPVVGGIIGFSVCLGTL